MADALSKAAIESIQDGIDFEAFAASQTTAPDVQAYRTALSPAAGYPVREQGQYYLVQHLHWPTQVSVAPRVEKDGF